MSGLPKHILPGAVRGRRSPQAIPADEILHLRDAQIGLQDLEATSEQVDAFRAARNALQDLAPAQLQPVAAGFASVVARLLELVPEEQGTVLGELTRLQDLVSREPHTLHQLHAAHHMMDAHAALVGQQAQLGGLMAAGLLNAAERLTQMRALLEKSPLSADLDAALSCLYILRANPLPETAEFAQVLRYADQLSTVLQKLQATRGQRLLMQYHFAEFEAVALRLHRVLDELNASLDAEAIPVDALEALVTATDLMGSLTDRLGLADELDSRRAAGLHLTADQRGLLLLTGSLPRSPREYLAFLDTPGSAPLMQAWKLEATRSFKVSIGYFLTLLHTFNSLNDKGLADDAVALLRIEDMQGNEVATLEAFRNLLQELHDSLLRVMTTAPETSEQERQSLQKYLAGEAERLSLSGYGELLPVVTHELPQERVLPRHGFVAPPTEAEIGAMSSDEIIRQVVQPLFSSLRSSVQLSERDEQKLAGYLQRYLAHRGRSGRKYLEYLFPTYGRSARDGMFLRIERTRYLVKLDYLLDQLGIDVAARAAAVVRAEPAEEVPAETPVEIVAEFPASLLDDALVTSSLDLYMSLEARVDRRGDLLSSNSDWGEITIRLLEIHDEIFEEDLSNEDAQDILESLRALEQEIGALEVQTPPVAPVAPFVDTPAPPQLLPPAAAPVAPPRRVVGAVQLASDVEVAIQGKSASVRKALIDFVERSRKGAQFPNADLIGLLTRAGLPMRRSGSHHTFTLSSGESSKTHTITLDNANAPKGAITSLRNFLIMDAAAYNARSGIPDTNGSADNGNGK